MTLTEKPVTAVTVDGKKYRINTGHTAVLSVLEFMSREDVLDEDKIDFACHLLVRFTPRSFGQRNKVIEAVYSVLFPDRKEKAEMPVFDFTQDADYIYAAFLQAYNIDLHHDILPWCHFYALMRSLPEQTKMAQIINLRATPIPAPTKYNQDEIKRLKAAKAAVALKITEEMRRQLFSQSIKNAMKGG